jgi:general secretion pathway protein M
MKNWFESLQIREKIFVLTGAVFLVVAVVYLGIWTPLDRGQKSLSLSVGSWETALIELQPLTSQLQPLVSAQSQQIDHNQSLVVIIDNSLRARGLYTSLQRSQPITSSRISVEFENVAFDDLVLWLGDLSMQYGLEVWSGNFSYTRDFKGRVNSTITLERS